MSKKRNTSLFPKHSRLSSRVYKNAVLTILKKEGKPIWISELFSKHGLPYASISKKCGKPSRFLRELVADGKIKVLMSREYKPEGRKLRKQICLPDANSLKRYATRAFEYQLISKIEQLEQQIKDGGGEPLPTELTPTELTPTELTPTELTPTEPVQETEHRGIYDDPDLEKLFGALQEFLSEKKVKMQDKVISDVHDRLATLETEATYYKELCNKYKSKMDALELQNAELETKQAKKWLNW